MSGTRALYEEVILDHNKSPRNFRKIAPPALEVEGFNPLCGDHFTVYLQMNGDVIADIAFQGAGCAISKSSASVMTTVLKGKTREEARELFQRFHHMITSSMEEPVDETGLGKLLVFSGVREFPVRTKCATLAWHTLASALDGKPDEPVSTE
jgi:nitrogen fixation NifU-like protein